MNENIDLVIFTVAERMFALETMYVHEILDHQPVTKLPFVEHYIDGLVSVEGIIATQIDLESYISGNKQVETNEENEKSKDLIILKLEGNLFAIKIHQVLMKIDLDRTRLQLINQNHSGIDGETGSIIEHSIVKAEFEWESKTIILLDGIKFKNVVEIFDAPKTRKGIIAKVSEAKEDKNKASEKAYLIVQSKLEHFAFLLEEVVEIIPAQEITPVPGSPAVILGITVIRGAPLLMLSVGVLLDEKDFKQESSSDFIILNINDNRLGLVFDRVLGISKFADECLHETTISSNKASGVLVSDDAVNKGKVLTLLDPTKLIDQSCIDKITGYIPEFVEREVNDEGELLSVLLIKLNKENYAIPVDSINRIVNWSKASKLDDDYLKDTDLPIVGLTELEGSVIPVINVLGKEYYTMEKVVNDGYVIIGSGKDNLAISFEQAQRLIKIPKKTIVAFSNSDNQLLSGIANYENTLVSVIDTGPLLKASRG